MGIPEGFVGQHLMVLPRPTVLKALRTPPTARLLVTDIGRYPHAVQHGMERTHGIDRAIIIVCTAGAGWCVVGGRRYAVGTGQVVVIPPRAVHAYGASATDPWTISWMHLAGADVSDLVAAAGARTDRPVLVAADLHRCSALIDEALRRLERDDTPANLIAASGAAWHLMALLAADRARLHTSDRIRALIDQLSEDVAAPVRVAELAATAGLSPSHFAALFRQATGVGVVAYQTRLRMNRARQLLDTTEASVQEVGSLVGYRDPFYFSRQFRRVHGLSPRDYRSLEKG